MFVYYLFKLLFDFIVYLGYRFLNYLSFIAQQVKVTDGNLCTKIAEYRNNLEDRR